MGPFIQPTVIVFKKQLIKTLTKLCLTSTAQLRGGEIFIGLCPQMQIHFSVLISCVSDIHNYVCKFGLHPYGNYSIYDKSPKIYPTCPTNMYLPEIERFMYERSDHRRHF